MCFLRQCCTHCLCPTLWSQCPKTGSVLAMQPLCRSHDWTVVNHYCTQNWGLKPCVFCGNAALTVCAPHCGAQCSKTGSVLAMQPLCRSHGYHCGKSLLHTKQGSHHVFFAAMLHSLFVPHNCGTNWSAMLQNWLGLGHAAFVQKSWLDCGKSLFTHKTGVSPCVFSGNAALTVCAPHCGHNAPKLARSWPCSLCAEVMVGLW